MNKKILMIVVAAVALGAIATASLIQNLGNGEEDGVVGDKTYTFTDAKGVEHAIPVPVSKVSAVHEYIPIFLKVLGVEDEVAGLDEMFGPQLERYFPNSFNIGGWAEPDGATMIANGSKVILSPVAMGLSNGDALREMGITVIYLDVTEPQVIESSLEILVNLFGNTDGVQSKRDAYLAFFRECGEFVENFNFETTENKYFALYKAVTGFMQTHRSAAVHTIEGVSGKSYTRVIAPDYDGRVIFTPSAAELFDFDKTHGLDYVFTYTLDTPLENYDAFNAFMRDFDISELTCHRNGDIYALAAHCVNGALSCVAQILFAGIFGADVGNKAADMIVEFNSTFGLDFSTENLVVRYP